MTIQKNALDDLAATSVEGSNIKSHAQQFTVNDALRNSVLWRLLNLNLHSAREDETRDGVSHERLVDWTQGQGFTAEQARDAIESLVFAREAVLNVVDGRIFVQEVRA